MRECEAPQRAAPYTPTGKRAQVPSTTGRTAAACTGADGVPAGSCLIQFREKSSGNQSGEEAALGHARRPPPAAGLGLFIKVACMQFQRSSGQKRLHIKHCNC